MHTPELYYGIDIGGTKMELVACDENLNVCYRQRVRTPTDDYDEFVDAIVDLVQHADLSFGARPAVGLGVPGIIDAATGTHLCANLPCLTGRALLPALSHRLESPVVIGNDCQCFALSEACGGAADGAPSMFGLIIGTGAGAGYVLDGHLVRGRNGVAGEWGHWPMAPQLLERYRLPALPCACGSNACLETYVSGTGLRKLFYRLTGIEGIGAEDLLVRSNAGDPVAQRVFAVHLDLMGAALARIVLAYDPHVIVLGGGLSQLPHLYTNLPAATAAHLMPGLAVPPILLATFGDAGGARGAALLARQATNQLTAQ